MRWNRFQFGVFRGERLGWAMRKFHPFGTEATLGAAAAHPAGLRPCLEGAQEDET
jgi:hypothetical protein